MEGLGALEKDQVIILLQDREPGIRENAIVLAEHFLKENSSMEKALISLRDDEIGIVRRSSMGRPLAVRSSQRFGKKESEWEFQ